jgi:hypothetical protein
MTFKEMGNQLPPCISYKTFSSFLGNLQPYVPTRIDLSYLGAMYSVPTGTKLMSAMRFLNLIDANSRATTELKVLVSATGAHRAAWLRHVAEEAYPFVSKGLDVRKATYAELQNAFLSNYQLEDAVCRKCIKFFIALSADADIPLSLQLIQEFE